LGRSRQCPVARIAGTRRISVSWPNLHGPCPGEQFHHDQPHGKHPWATLAWAAPGVSADQPGRSDITPDSIFWFQDTPDGSPMTHILAIDQGTTSSRAIVFRHDCTVAAIAQQEFPQHFPQSGWAEHDPEDIWHTVLPTTREALAKVGLSAPNIAAIGIANQRETTLVWDRATGKPIHHAIVWQDRRTGDICRRLKNAGREAEVTARTGLLLDPYFSASKIAWLIDHVPD